MAARDDDENVLFPAAADVAAEVARWLGHLGSERRMSRKTLDAYQRDVRQFLAFMSQHLGGQIGRAHV